MGYYIDLQAISLDDYKKQLNQRYLLPSRMILREAIEKRFACLQRQRLHTVHDIQQALKTKKKLQEFSQKSGIPEEYLTILNREVKSLLPTPNKLKDFPGISEKTVVKLEELGIKTTLQLFEKVLTQKDRKELASQAELAEQDVLKLTKLTDLSRIKWVGAVFARLLFDSGYDTVEKVSSADYEDLYNTLIRINQERQYTKGKVGLNDMKLCVEAACDVPLDIEY